MGLVTHIAGGSARMLRRDDLRKLLRFGDVRLVATGAKHGGLQFRRLDRDRVFRMLGQRPMTRLAVDSRMPSFLFQFEHVGMTRLAGLVAGKGNRMRGDLGDCVAPVMAVLPKATRDEKASRQ